jgi:hypothetical protein
LKTIAAAAQLDELGFLSTSKLLGFLAHAKVLFSVVETRDETE